MRSLCYFVLVMSVLIGLGCSCVSRKPRLDPQNAIDGNDLTAILSCEQEQVSVGYLVCREIEGQSAESQYLYVHAPPEVECNSEACVYFKIFFPDGRPTYEGKIKKGESRALVPFSELINSKTFELSTRGFYGVSVTMTYQAHNRMELKTYAQGYVLVHVVKKNYLSLLESPESEYFAWDWKAGSRSVKMTTGFRVYLSPPLKKSDPISYSN